MGENFMPDKEQVQAEVEEEMYTKCICNSLRRFKISSIAIHKTRILY